MMLLLRAILILGVTLPSSSCVWWFFEPKAEKKVKAPPALPTKPLTWPEFVKSSQGRGLTIPQLEKRFTAADANRDGLLTPMEMAEHRQRAALRKQQQSSQ